LIRTLRLELRELVASDADFVTAILNDADFVQYVGDRGVRNASDALAYIERAREGYLKNGFGLYAVWLTASNAPVGLCGLVRREILTGADVGYAMLPAFRRQGYGREAVAAIFAQAESLGLGTLFAICSPLNVASRKLLERVGFRFDREMNFPGETVKTCLYVRESAS
jgi:ribosomal-protein-alanine N-acetyltransferase